MFTIRYRNIGQLGIESSTDQNNIKVKGQGISNNYFSFLEVGIEKLLNERNRTSDDI